LDRERLRSLYEGLDELSQAAVQEATHDSVGWLNQDRFEAKYGRLPLYYEDDAGESYFSRRRPTRLSLFFITSAILPSDVLPLLRDFVPAPRALNLPVLSEAPATVPQEEWEWKDGERVRTEIQVPLRRRDTEREALHDLPVVLRLIEREKLRVSAKKRLPTKATVEAVAEVLQGGDFYTHEDEDEYRDDDASDLSIKSFAWPILVQAGGLASASGD